MAPACGEAVDAAWQGPFVALLGIVHEAAADGESCLSLELRPALSDRDGSAHGAVVTALLECAMVQAALSRSEDAREIVMVDMHVSFLRASSGRLVATGRASGGGRSVCFCEGELSDASGALTARAMGTLHYRVSLPSSTALPATAGPGPAACRPASSASGAGG